MPVHDASVSETSISDTARRLFAPIAPNYDRWSALLSLGQDPRWRGELVKRLDLPSGARVPDVAAGTGLISLASFYSGWPVANDKALGLMFRAP